MVWCFRYLVIYAIPLHSLEAKRRRGNLQEKKHRTVSPAMLRYLLTLLYPMPALGTVSYTHLDVYKRQVKS